MWTKREIEDHLADCARRAAAARKSGDDEAVRKLARESRQTRTLPVRALGAAIAGVILILIGISQLK